jgi:hypothetical protein
LFVGCLAYTLTAVSGMLMHEAAAARIIAVFFMLYHPSMGAKAAGGERRLMFQAAEGNAASMLSCSDRIINGY